MMRARDTATLANPPSLAGMATCLPSTKTRRRRLCRPLRERRGDGFSTTQPAQRGYSGARETPSDGLGQVGDEPRSP
jgi:hypothetical protein